MTVSTDNNATAATIITRYNGQVVFPSSANREFFFCGCAAFAREEVGLARAALPPSPDRGRRRTKHYITSSGEEGSDGTSDGVS